MANSQPTGKPEVKDDLRDKNLAAEERPVPSQAEGELKTIDEDLASQLHKEQK